MNQKDLVLKYMQDFGSITPQEAVFDLGVYRLSAVIFDLRDAGYKIETETEYAKNRYGKPTHYARYKFNREPVQTTLF